MQSSSQPVPSPIPEGDARITMGDYLVTDVPEAQRRLSALLGRDEPVSVEVLHAAIEDPIYAMHLMASRSSPELMSILLARAPRQRPVDPLSQAIPEPADPSKTALLGRFARAMAEWSKTGFQLADPDTHAARLDACRACPHLRAPGGSLLMRMAASVGLDGHSCGLCGCSVTAKSRIARESCPGEDPARKGYNRWGQQMPAR
jgi:hypothetical protein